MIVKAVHNDLFTIESRNLLVRVAIAHYFKSNFEQGDYIVNFRDEWLDRAYHRTEVYDLVINGLQANHLNELAARCVLATLDDLHDYLHNGNDIGIDGEGEPLWDELLAYEYDGIDTHPPDVLAPNAFGDGL